MKTKSNNGRPTVLLIGNIPPPYGGVPAHIATVSPYLVKQGWNVIVLSSGSPKGIGWRDGVKIYKPRTRENVKALFRMRLPISAILQNLYLLLISPRRFLGFISFANRIAQIVEDERVDVISAYHIYAGLAALPIARRHDIPMATTIFGEIFSESEFYGKIRERVRDLFDSSRQLLSCSCHCAESTKLLNLSHQVDTLYYGIDTNRFKPQYAGGRIREKNGWADDDDLVIFVGRMNYSMGLNVLLDAIPQLLLSAPDTRFLICGAESTLTPHAMKVRADYPDNVTVLANVDPETLPKCYAAATVAVAPSINERACLGLAIMEAMATELPVIGCAVGGTGEVIVDGVTGHLIPPNDSDALAESIAATLALPDKGRAMGVQGRVRVLSRFDIHMTNRHTAEIFSQLANSQAER